VPHNEETPPLGLTKRCPVFLHSGITLLMDLTRRDNFLATNYSGLTNAGSIAAERALHQVQAQSIFTHSTGMQVSSL